MEKYQELLFKYIDLIQAIKLRWERVSDRAKYSVALSFILVWIALCSLVAYPILNEKSVITEELIYVEDVAQSTIKKAKELIEAGHKAEAFKLLATHKNNFEEEYMTSEMEQVDRLLDSVLDEAPTITIEELYKSEDFSEHNVIYKFKGTVVSYDNDPLYGVSHTVSDDGVRGPTQLEVMGLVDVAVGSVVEFYGVPEFISAANPIEVEAYVPESVEEE